MSRSRALPLVVAAAAVLALTACGNADGGDYSSNPIPVQAPALRPGETPPPLPTPAPFTPAVPPPAAPAAPVAPVVAPAPGAGAALAAREVPGFGTVVADGQGFTLYRFDRDTAFPPTSTCVDACAANWPPVVVDPEGALDLEGVEQSAVATVQRPDGSSQLTIAGWPVYRFAGDTAPGATGGNGVDGTWFAVAPDGAKAG